MTRAELRQMPHGLRDYSCKIKSWIACAGDIYVENGVTPVETWRYDTFIYGFRYIPPICLSAYLICL